MKRILYLISIVLPTVVACGTINNLPYSRDSVSVSSGKTSVTCVIDNNPVMFHLNSLWDDYYSISFPIITGRNAESYDAWLSYVKDDDEHRDILPEKEYLCWQKIVGSLIKKYSRGFDSLLFTVPGRVIAYTQKCSDKDVRKLRPRPDCAIFVNGAQLNRYRILDTDYKPSFMIEEPQDYIFRSVEKDGSHKMLVVIDRIYLKDSNEMLCIMYTCMGKRDYVYNTVKKTRTGSNTFYYHGTTSWMRFNPLTNFSMSFEHIYRQCDPISIGVLKFLRGKK